MSTIKNMSQDFDEMSRQFENLCSKDLPDHIIETAEEMVQDSFEKEKYQGSSNSDKWEKRKNDEEGDKPRDQRRGLLVDGSDLIKSTGAERRGEDIVIYADTKYAQIHNEGLEGNAFGKHKFKMPKRQFMPIEGEESPVLSDAIEKFVNDEMDKIFK